NVHKDRQVPSLVIEKTSVTFSRSVEFESAAVQSDRAPISEVQVAKVAVAENGASFRPVVRLFSDDVLVHRVEGLNSHYETVKLPLIALSFEYGSADETSDPASEARARRFLETFGAVDLDCLD